MMHEAPVKVEESRSTLKRATKWGCALAGIFLLVWHPQAFFGLVIPGGLLLALIVGSAVGGYKEGGVFGALMAVMGAMVVIALLGLLGYTNDSDYGACYATARFC